MNLTCDEIYFTSNEKSALTGHDGFSVRTFTSGMDTQLVSQLASDCNPGYSVNPDRELHLDDLTANPRVVYDYPPTLTYRIHTDASGVKRHVVTRTVYVATDYGFFLDRDTSEATRVGSNYFTHIIASQQLPSTALFAAIATGQMFSPQDYSIDKSNAEMRRLLTGEISLLQPKILEINDSPVAISAKFLPVIKAILTAHSNKNAAKEASLGKIIVKALSADTAGVLRAMSLLPDSLIENLTFTSNYTQGYGVPEEFCIAIVNEFNTKMLYEDSYVVADIIGGNNSNIPANPIFDAMDAAVASGRLSDLDNLIELYLRVDHASNPDYDFILKAFRATKSTEGLSVGEITPEFVSALESSALSEAEKSTLRSKIAEIIDRTFLTSERPDDVTAAIAASEAVRKYCRGGVTLSPAASRRVTKMMLGVNAYIHRFITPSNVTTVITLMDRNEVGGQDEFFTALAKSESAQVWVELIRWYFLGNLDDIDTILNHITSSALSEQQKSDAVAALYPMPASASQFYGYFLRQPAKVTELKPVVRKMAEVAKDEFFSGIIANSGDNLAVINGLNDAVTIYFRRRMNSDPNSAMKELIVFVNKVKPVVYNSFSSASEFIDTYLSHVEKHPGMQEKIILESLHPISEILTEAAKARFTALLDLYGAKVPASVTSDTIFIASAMNASPAFMSQLLSKWLESNISPEGIRTVAQHLRRLSPDVMASLVTGIWNKFKSNPELRAKAVLALTDNIDWPKDQRHNFLSTCTDKDLVDFLSDSDKFFNKILRRFRGLF